MPDPVVLEQLVWTIAEQTLTAPRAQGAVLVSGGWPDSLHYSSAALRSLCGPFFVDGTASRVAGMSPMPSSVTLSDVPEGRLLSVKTYLGKESYGRAGRYLCHLLLDRGRRLSAADALDLAESSHIVRDWSPDRSVSTGEKPLVVVLPLNSGTAPVRCDSVEKLLTMLLDWVSNGVSWTVSMPYSADLAATLRSALNLIPPDLTRSLTYSTQLARPVRDELSLTFSDPAISSFDDSPARESMWSEAASIDLLDVASAAFESQALSRLLLRTGVRERQTIPPEIDTLNRLRLWAERRGVMTKRPSELTDAEITSIVDSDDLAEWIEVGDAPDTLLRWVGIRSERAESIPWKALVGSTDRVLARRATQWANRLFGLAVLDGRESSHLRTALAGAGVPERDLDEAILDEGRRRRDLAGLTASEWNILKRRLDAGFPDFNLDERLAWVQSRGGDVLTGPDWSSWSRWTLERWIDGVGIRPSDDTQIRSLITTQPAKAIPVIMSAVEHGSADALSVLERVEHLDAKLARDLTDRDGFWSRLPWKERMRWSGEGPEARNRARLLWAEAAQRLNVDGDALAALSPALRPEPVDDINRTALLSELSLVAIGAVGMLGIVMLVGGHQILAAIGIALAAMLWIARVIRSRHVA